MTDSATPRMGDGGRLRRLLVFARPYTWWLVVGLVLLLLQVVSTNAMPLLIKRAIDAFLKPEGTELSAVARVGGLRRVCLGVGGLLVGMFLFRVAHAYVMTWVGQHVLRDLRVAVYRKVLELPMRRVDRLRVGRLMTRATSDLDALQELMRNGVVGMLANVLMLIGAVVYMWILEWRLALALYTVFPVLAGLLYWVNRNSRRAQRRAREAVSGLNSLVQETLSGLFTLRVFNQRGPMMERLTARSGEVRAARMRVADWGTWHFPVLETTRALATAVLLLTCGLLVPEETGSLVAFLFYIRYFFRPLEELAEQSQRLQSGMASAERVFDLLDEPGDPPDPADPVRLERVRGDVVFDGVTFSYDEAHPVLRDVNFHIPEGRFAAVVGATGAGKSTLLSLLCRFYDPDAGAVRVDGVDIRDMARAELRRHLGMVQQEPELFSGTVADNIGLGRPGVDREAVERAAKRVNAHAFIEKLSNGYDTDLGEGGYRLSTGQKQLIAWPGWCCRIRRCCCCWTRRRRAWIRRRRRGFRRVWRRCGRAAPAS